MALQGRILSLSSRTGLIKNSISAFRTSAEHQNKGSRLGFKGWGAIGGGIVCGTLGVTAWKLNESDQKKTNIHLPQLQLTKPVYAASAPAPQENVASQTKDHALYLWIHVKSNADAKKVAKVVANIQKHVESVSPASLRDENDEVWAGVGFGPDFLSKLGKKAPEEYHMADRRGSLGNMPSTGGDVFVHAKSNSISKLFELAQLIERELPSGSVDKFQDIYSFVYKNGRDLSGFIDGTENPADDTSRSKVAVSKTGGSFCITQKWIHDHEFIQSQKKSALEGFVGRAYEDSTELKKKPATSHVARMTTGADFNATKKFEIVRQSMPYGTVGGESGLFFIAFAASPQNFDYMLDRMTGTGTATDKQSDEIMRLSRCVQGNYWYFPSKDELKSFA